MPSAARRKAALVLTRSEPGDVAANAAEAAFFRDTLVERGAFDVVEPIGIEPMTS